METVDQELLNIIDITDDEEIIEKMGTNPYVLVSNNNLYISVAAMKAIPAFRDGNVRIGKAGRYLLFHFCDNKAGFKVCMPKSGGAHISIGRVLTKTGIRPDQINGKRPMLIPDGFGIQLY